jgi:nitrate reductase NapAB chaperone NapD
MNDVSIVELQIIQVIRDLKPYEKIEIKLKDNKPGEVVVIITSNKRMEYAI